MKAKGWGIKEDIKICKDEYFVELKGLCTCWTRHSFCSMEKRCFKMFQSEDLQSDEIRDPIEKLKNMMKKNGQKFPKDWDCSNPSFDVVCARHNKQVEFEMKHFKKCRLYQIEIQEVRKD